MNEEHYKEAFAELVALAKRDALLVSTESGLVQTLFYEGPCEDEPENVQLHISNTNEHLCTFYEYDRITIKMASDGKSVLLERERSYEDLQITGDDSDPDVYSVTFEIYNS